MKRDTMACLISDIAQFSEWIVFIRSELISKLITREGETIILHTDPLDLHDANEYSDRKLKEARERLESARLRTIEDEIRCMTCETGIHGTEDFNGSILDSLPAHIAVIDDRGYIIYTNKPWRDFAASNGVAPDHGTGTGINYFAICENASGEFSEEAGPALAGMKQVLEGRKEDYHLVYPCHSPTDKRWFLMYARQLRNHARKGIIVFHINITPRIRAEIAVQEKEIMIREIHHRVKNNLQVVNSMINLQAAKFSGPENIAMLKDIQNRIKAMSRVHEQFYASEDSSVIDFSAYLRTFIPELVKSYDPEEKITLSIIAHDLNVGQNTAIPLGLIVNELVINSLKHAFPEEKEGHIDIRLDQDNGRISLTVSDNGVGMPAHVQTEDPDTLGLGMVKDLVDQIDGAVEFANACGTSCRISFLAARPG